MSDDRGKKPPVAKSRAKPKGPSDVSNKVGYKNPPKATQFPPGKSGNPKGRPKRAKSLYDDVQEELNSTIVVTEGGKRVRMTKRRVIVKALVNKSAHAEISAVRELLQMLRNMPMMGVVETEEDRKRKEALVAKLMEHLNLMSQLKRELGAYKKVHGDLTDDEKREHGLLPQAQPEPPPPEDEDDF